MARGTASGLFQAGKILGGLILDILALIGIGEAAVKFAARLPELARIARELRVPLKIRRPIEGGGGAEEVGPRGGSEPDATDPTKSPPEIPSAKQLAEQRSADIRSLMPRRDWPRAASAAVDRTTGRAYYGDSGFPRPSLDEIHPDLRSRMPDPSLENWPVQNCAEFKAANNALNDGARIDNLDIYTVSVRDGQPFPRCENCQVTTQGAYVPSDLSPDD